MIKLAYASFGREAPDDLSGLRQAAVWLLCFAFVVVAVGITALLNFFALFTGTIIVFLGRDGLKIRFLKILGRVPAIALALPVLLGYAIWHQATVVGTWFAIWPIVAVWCAGGLFILLAAVLGGNAPRSRRERPGQTSTGRH